MMCQMTEHSVQHVISFMRTLSQPHQMLDVQLTWCQVLVSVRLHQSVRHVQLVVYCTTQLVICCVVVFANSGAVL